MTEQEQEREMRESVPAAVENPTQADEGAARAGADAPDGPREPMPLPDEQPPACPPEQAAVPVPMPTDAMPEPMPRGGEGALPWEQMPPWMLHWMAGASPYFARQAQQLAACREQLHRMQFEQDLASIRAAYPDERATAVEQLGDDFMNLCAHGFPPLVAYEAVRAAGAHRKAAPPSMGDVSGRASHERDYFSREEVDAMTPEQVRQHYNVIRKSQEKW